MRTRSSLPAGPVTTTSASPAVAVGTVTKSRMRPFLSARTVLRRVTSRFDDCSWIVTWEFDSVALGLDPHGLSRGEALAVPTDHLGVPIAFRFAHRDLEGARPGVAGRIGCRAGHIGHALGHCSHRCWIAHRRQGAVDGIIGGGRDVRDPRRTVTPALDDHIAALGDRRCHGVAGHRAIVVENRHEVPALDKSKWHGVACIHRQGEIFGRLVDLVVVDGNDQLRSRLPVGEFNQEVRRGDRTAVGGVDRSHVDREQQ